ncbi:MAG: hypothetical protein HFG41_00945 [Coprococcus sp.]|nr:hypothetical protein [Coprococcus sp.]
MKRFFAMILIASLAVSIAACGGTADNKEKESSETSGNEDTSAGSNDEESEAKDDASEDKEKGDEAPGELSLKQFAEDVNSDKAKAEKDCIGNMYQITATVDEVKDGYCELMGVNTFNYNEINVRARVYLPSDVLAGLKDWDKITVSGTIESIEDGILKYNGEDFETVFLNMPDAQIVK